MAKTRALLAAVLTDAGFAVRAEGTGAAALSSLEQWDIDAVLLALNLPDLDGLEILQGIRALSEVPVIIVSARASYQDRVTALELGADDYVTKPFSVPELTARIRAQLRGHRASPRRRHLSFPDMVIDFDRREVLVRRRPVALRRREFDLLAFLAASPGQVFTRAQLLEQVWGSDARWQSEATVTEHIRRIRDKIEADPGSQRWIQTVHAVGYRFERRARPPAQQSGEARRSS